MSQGNHLFEDEALFQAKRCGYEADPFCLRVPSLRFMHKSGIWEGFWGWAISEHSDDRIPGSLLA